MTHCWRAQLYLVQGRLDEALADARAETSEIFRLVATAMVQFARGDQAASDAALAELIEKAGAGGHYQVAEVLAVRSEVDRAFEWLERTFADRDPGMSYMKMDWAYRKLHGDPRWQALLEKMQLAG
jgi:hypothetical protein